MLTPWPLATGAGRRSTRVGDSDTNSLNKSADRFNGPYRLRACLVTKRASVPTETLVRSLQPMTPLGLSVWTPRQSSRSRRGRLPASVPPTWLFSQFREAARLKLPFRSRPMDKDYFNSLPSMIGPKHVQHLLGIAHATLYRCIKDGRLDKPKKIGGNKWSKVYIAWIMTHGLPPKPTPPPPSSKSGSGIQKAP